MTYLADTPAVAHSPLIEALAAIVGPAHVLVEEAQRRFFSVDLAAEGALVACVAQPGSAEELSRVVAHSTGAGYAVIPRGGGFSYTGGYRPGEERTVMVDLRRMNRIVEINAQDLYVTVECGCTWRELY